jgi:hypothetical protein
VFSNAIAVAALLLSGLSLYLQSRQRRPAVRVTAEVETHSLPVGVDSFSPMAPRDVPVLSVRFINPSERPVHVSDVALALGGVMLPLIEFNALYKGLRQPFTVEPLRSHNFVVRGVDLGDLLHSKGISGSPRVRIVAHDEAGKTHRSPELSLEVQKLVDGEIGADSVR